MCVLFLGKIVDHPWRSNEVKPGVAFLSPFASPRLLFHRKISRRLGPEYCANSFCPVARQAKLLGREMMTARVPMVSLERARELGEAMGMPARRTQSEAFRV